jgi:hypothetical protein
MHLDYWMTDEQFWVWLKKLCYSFFPENGELSQIPWSCSCFERTDGINRKNYVRQFGHVTGLCHSTIFGWNLILWEGSDTYYDFISIFHHDPEKTLDFWDSWWCLIVVWGM